MEEIMIERSTFKELVNKPNFYDIMSALRGPDIDTLVYIKWIFTCRIRYLAGITNDRKIALRINVREKPFIYKSDLDNAIDEAQGLLRYDFEVGYRFSTFLNHYFGHVVDALISLDHLGMIEPKEYYFLFDLASEFKESVIKGKCIIDLDKIRHSDEFVLRK